MNRKGFTLIELLATIIVLGLVVGITIYFGGSIIGKTKEKTYQVTLNNIKRGANDYLKEYSNELSFNELDEGKEYQCVKVSDLVEKGFFDKNITESMYKKDNNVNNVSLSDNIYVERNTNTKVVTNIIYNDAMCNVKANYSVEKQYFETLNNAYSSSICQTAGSTTSGCEIKVIKSNEDSSTFSIASGKKVTLNTSDKTITKSGDEITNNGTLTISGNGKIISSNLKNIISNYNLLTITGNVIVENTNIVNVPYAIYNSGSFTKLVITGGTIKGYEGIYNRDGATVDASGGQIIGNNYYGIDNQASSKLNISGTVQIVSNVSGSKGKAVENFGIVSMTGGTVHGKYAGINNSGTVNISNGTVIGDSYYGILNGTGTVTVGSLDKEYSNTNPSIIGGYNGYRDDKSTAVLNFNSGIFNGKSSAFSTLKGTVVYRTNYVPASSSNIIDGITYDSKYLKMKEKSESILTLSETSGSVNKGSSKSFTVTSNRDGVITVTSSSILTATVSQEQVQVFAGTPQTITVNGVNAGNATITLFMAADDNYKETSNTYSLTVKKILYSWSASCNCYNEDDTLCKSTTINKYGYSSRNDASSACTNNKTQECRNKCLSCDMGRIVPGQCSTDSYTQ